MRRNQELVELEQRAGIFTGAMDWLPREEIKGADGRISFGDVPMGFDAQPTLITNPNAGIPAFLTQWVDPKVIEVILAPNNATKIVAETRKGNWVDETAMFPMVESTGEVSSYGDYSENGRAGANVQFEYRQSYGYQTFIRYGEKEAERMGRAYVDWVSRLNIGAAVTMGKFQNQSYFYGISGLVNYGLLNDPTLSAALTPSTKQAGGTSWQNALPTEILADVQSLFAKLQTQTGSNLDLDTPMVLALHSISELYLANTNSFGLTAMEMIKKVFPNLRVQQAPQYLSGTTYSCQLIVDAIMGQRTAELAFTEKMRAHPLIAATSSWQQKKSGGTWGAIIYEPIGIAQMSGI